VTDEEIDGLLSRLNREGFGLPYMARARDYLDDNKEPRAEQLAALRAADEQAHQDNRDALRRALAGPPD
jgi:hypothetical protein